MKNKTAIFLQLKEKISSKNFKELENLVENSDDAVLDKLILLRYKNPFLLIILAIIVPGIDRIYMKQVVLGVFKFVYIFASYLYINIAIDMDLNMLPPAILLIIALIFYIIDVFIMPKKAKEYNFKLIQELLENKDDR
ncbi:hypothetical protein CAV_0260 [Campylobacter avium LMG 24591]|uniref:Uncharacterized protein n=1 Tax=Campylobacter avium LMG 24591 TaxID=522484 RepID=A0A222MW69_9BACT|nr:hypothetical protein [Campylobacter avium]ASQ29932.1 hypothetical protein CAV_0260 [Campylobacter avium LMG 24591]OYD79031.1 hypothetical protein CAV8706_0262 [Campylobacter avium]